MHLKTLSLTNLKYNFLWIKGPKFLYKKNLFPSKAKQHQQSVKNISLSFSK